MAQRTVCREGRERVIGIGRTGVVSMVARIALSRRARVTCRVAAYASNGRMRPREREVAQIVIK